MKVIVFGATGKTGALVLQHALERGHEMTAFVRPSSAATLDAHVSASAGRLQIARGDIFDPASVRSATAGHDAAIVTLGSSSLTATTVRSAGTANVVAGLSAEGIDRLLVVSAMGVGESWSTLSFFNRLFFATLLRSSRRDHEAQEAAVKASSLDWTILRPSGLTDEPAQGGYAIGEGIRGKTSRIPRADVADALLDALEGNAFVRSAVTITN